MPTRPTDRPPRTNGRDDTTSRGDLIAFQAGCTAGVVMTSFLGIIRNLDYMPLNIEMLLGSWLTGGTTILTWLLGFGMHVVVSGLIGWLYGLGFRVLHRSGWLTGLILAIPHWGLAGLALLVLPRIHVMVPGWIPPPGAYSIGFGMIPFALFLIAHLIYGVVVGALYHHSLQLTPEDQALRNIVT